jgi:hypothetical protein
MSIRRHIVGTCGDGPTQIACECLKVNNVPSSNETRTHLERCLRLHLLDQRVGQRLVKLVSIPIQSMTRPEDTDVIECTHLHEHFHGQLGSDSATGDQLVERVSESHSNATTWSMECGKSEKNGPYDDPR